MTDTTTTTTAHPVRTIARIPGSKSITNRALLLAAAAVGTSRLRSPLISADTVAFRTALAGLGFRVAGAGGDGGREVCGAEGDGDRKVSGAEGDGGRKVSGAEGDGGRNASGAEGDGGRKGSGAESDGDWEVTGVGRGPTGSARVWCEDAGTAARFLPPFAAVGSGRFMFDGSTQLRARPLRPLADTLTALGAEVTTAPGGGLPMTLVTGGLDGGTITVDGSLSSQFLSGLLMSAPLMRTPVTFTVQGLVSRPYLDMTLALMRRFGAEVTERPGDVIEVRPGGYRAVDLTVEPDASTASYVFAAAAVTGTAVTVPGLGRDSLQGDLRFVDVLRRMGARVEVTETATTVTGGGPLRGGFSVDMGEISDTFMTLAAIAPLADASVTIRGIAHARLKESDRITAVVRNLRALGVDTEAGHDWLTVRPGPPTGTRIACHRDHRIGMAFSVLGLRVPHISLDDPSCVGKTFPGFHEELRRLFSRNAPARDTR